MTYAYKRDIICWYLTRGDVLFYPKRERTFKKNRRQIRPYFTDRLRIDVDLAAVLLITCTEIEITTNQVTHRKEHKERNMDIGMTINKQDDLLSNMTTHSVMKV